jgi:hypothetical protein
MFEGTGMNEERLVKVALQGGRYEAELHAPEETGIEAVHEGRVAAGRLIASGAADARVVSLRGGDAGFGRVPGAFRRQ